MHNDDHKMAQFADNIQMLSEGDAIAFEQSISKVKKKKTLVESLVCPWTLVKHIQFGCEVKGSPWRHTNLIYKII